MRPVKSYIAKRFQNSDAGLSLDTDALARYSDIIDLSIGDTDFITDDAIIDTAFREAKAGYTHYGDPKGDPELIRSVCDAWQTDFKQPLSPDHVLVTASSSMGMALVMLSVLDPGDEVIVFSPYFSLYRTQAEGDFTEEEAFSLRALTNHLNYAYYTMSRRPQQEKAQARSLEELVQTCHLTRREEEILRLVFQDWSNEEILDKLVISRHTLLKHLQNLYRKCGVSSRWDLRKLGP